MESTEGWIKLYQKIEETKMWTGEKFSRGQACVDLVLLAHREDTTVVIRGVVIPVQRGQVTMSKECIAKRWGWSKKKVMNFLKLLEKLGQITQQNSSTLGLITVINYNHYQPKCTAECTTKDTKDAPQTTPQKYHKKNANISEEEKSHTTNDTADDTTDLSEKQESTATISGEQEEKDKEREKERFLSHTLSSIEKDRGSVKESAERKQYRSLSYLQNIPVEDYTMLSKGLLVTEQQILRKAEELYNYCEYKGKKYKNYRRFLRNALLGDFPSEKVSSLPAGYKLRTPIHEIAN